MRTKGASAPLWQAGARDGSGREPPKPRRAILRHGMSENLGLVRSIYATWERGDFSSGVWAHPDIELVWSDGPSPGTWSGLAGVQAGWREFLAAWDDYRVHAEEYLTVDDETVLVLVRFKARGKTSGVEVGESWARGANLFHIRDGLVRRLVLYWERDRALADLGLEE